MILLIGLSGCGIFSIYPLYHDDDLIVNNDLIGLWENKEDGDFFQFDTLENKKYRVLWYDEEDTVFFEAGVVQLDDHLFFDFFPYDGKDESDMWDNMIRNFIPAHSFAKVDLHDGSFTIAEFDSERLIELFKSNRIRLAHAIPDDDYVVITASTDDLQKFISRYADDNDAFNESDTYLKRS